MSKKDIQIFNSLEQAEEVVAKAQIARDLKLNELLHSGDVGEIYKAQRFLQNVEKKEEGVKGKSMILDPQQAWGAQGYKQKNYNLSYDMLRMMAKTIIIKPIVETRKEQVLNFCEPQKDKYSMGFVIRPKKMKEKNGKPSLSLAQEKRVEELTEFILNCGNVNREWQGDNFHSFTRKFVQDSLTLDQGTAEVIRDRKGLPVEFLATDGATYRIADSYMEAIESNLKPEEEKNGYHPAYVQIYQGKIMAEFYPWELMFWVRNPSSSIFYNGYGRGELEDLIENVTATLNADSYNSNYFKVGSNPKGIVRLSGNINPGRMEEFRSQWQATMSGVRNAHKMMIVESDKMDFISTQQSNKDMEWARYFEFLIKISCAHFKIDPAEINFPLSGSTEQKPMFESDNKARLEFSKDKGLKPLIKGYQHQLNKYILNPLDPDYELVFEGLDADDPQQELQNNIMALQNYMTVNEIRRKYDLDDIEGGDIILNPILAQKDMMMMQMQMGQTNGEPQDYTNEGSSQEGGAEESNPIAKALQEDIERIFS